MQKKSLLFVIDSLEAAGAEKSLVSLLNLLDFTRYSVDLQLFSHGNELEHLVPKEVNILRPFKYTRFSNMNLSNSLIYSIKNSKLKMFFSRIKYSISSRIKTYRNSQKARIYWQCVSNVIERNPKVYDVAISYAQGVPTFYVADKVKSKLKIAWVNVSYRLEAKDKEFQKEFYDQFQNIVAVSDSTKEIFLEMYPNYDSKMKVIYDINNPQLIEKMGDGENPYQNYYNKFKILTIGRLANQKGYPIALEACKKLRDQGINFVWFALGKGPLKSEIEKYIKENDLQNHFILLGVKSNPYPYLKNSDIYVQTSLFEGFGLALAEARLLNIPIVTTRFDAVYNQMIDEKNGLVVDMNAAAVCDGILRIINNKDLKNKLIKFLQNEKKGNLEELNKFYQLIECERLCN